MANHFLHTLVLVLHRNPSGGNVRSLFVKRCLLVTNFSGCHQDRNRRVEGAERLYVTTDFLPVTGIEQFVQAIGRSLRHVVQIQVFKKRGGAEFDMSNWLLASINWRIGATTSFLLHAIVAENNRIGVACLPARAALGSAMPNRGKA